MSDTLAHIDPTQIDFANGKQVRPIVVALMNQVETLQQTLATLKEENQHLQDEIARLQGEKPKPKFKPNTASAEAKSKQKKRGKPRPERKARIEIDETQTLDVEDLPPDARFLGYREVIVQDIVFRRLNIRYLLKRYYSEQQGRFYEAASPAQGQSYGAQLRSFVLLAYYQCGVFHQALPQQRDRRGSVEGPLGRHAVRLHQGPCQ